MAPLLARRMQFWQLCWNRFASIPKLFCSISQNDRQNLIYSKNQKRFLIKSFLRRRKTFDKLSDIFPPKVRMAFAQCPETRCLFFSQKIPQIVTLARRMQSWQAWWIFRPEVWWFFAQSPQAIKNFVFFPKKPQNLLPGKLKENLDNPADLFTKKLKFSPVKIREIVRISTFSKTYFSSKRSSGHLECGSDDPVESFLPTVLKCFD